MLKVTYCDYFRPADITTIFVKDNFKTKLYAGDKIKNEKGEVATIHTMLQNGVTGGRADLIPFTIIGHYEAKIKTQYRAFCVNKSKQLTHIYGTKE